MTFNDIIKNKRSGVFYIFLIYNLREEIIENWTIFGALPLPIVDPEKFELSTKRYSTLISTDQDRVYYV
mgnify:CR=1 FL=1|jgi:hypothetical protein